MSAARMGGGGVVFALAVVPVLAADRPGDGASRGPLKVFILAGQSNMEGKAQVKTIARLNLTDDARPMYRDMNVKDGLPSAVENAYGVYFNGGDKHRGQERPVSVEKGPLQPGFGAEMTENTTFGPEYTFAIYMRKHLQNPILIIKTAWGGRDLIQQFRPPSAGPYEKEVDRFGNPTGYYYGRIIQHVKTVLADPGSYHPGYRKEDGYELAGFVWFQGFNDLVGPYPEAGGKKDYSEYGRLMACFIRDVRKDLDAPRMPFVIGVMGIGGPIENENDGQFGFRKAQEAPAALPEFKGNVAAVRTEHCWDMELARIQGKVADAARKRLLAENPKLGGRALEQAVGKAARSMASEVLTPEELKLLQTGTSNAAFHYMGSAYIYGRIGKAFADALNELGKGAPRP